MLYPRLITQRVIEALEDSPVVLIHGPRQCGKSTLAQTITRHDPTAKGTNKDTSPSQSNRLSNYSYISFDDSGIRATARDDPKGFIRDLPDRVVLDEIQLVPELVDEIKLEVDRNRRPGKFLLTGSVGIGFMPRLSERLVGRLETIRLHPLAQVELRHGTISNRQEESFFNALFGDGFSWYQCERLGVQLTDMINVGGFPPVVARSTAARQRTWLRNYTYHLVNRDVSEVSRIHSRDVLVDLLTAAALQTAQLYNLSKLSSSFELSRYAIRDYIRVLENFFLVEKLPAWHVNQLKRLIKAPKLHLTDTGLASNLIGIESNGLLKERSLQGKLCESFVLQELRRQASWYDDWLRFYHLRDKDGVEVDIIIEHPSGVVAGVEVKLSSTPRSRDFRGLRKLRDALGTKFVRGVVLYDGEYVLPFGDKLQAVPISRLWTNK